MVIEEVDGTFVYETDVFYDFDEACKTAVTQSGFNQNVWLRTASGSFLIALA